MEKYKVVDLKCIMSLNKRKDVLTSYELMNNHSITLGQNFHLDYKITINGIEEDKVGILFYEDPNKPARAIKISKEQDFTHTIGIPPIYLTIKLEDIREVQSNGIVYR